jgi:Zn-dependent membrane protease YugP
MAIAVAALAVLAILLLPQLWVRRTFSRHAAERPDLPGTGGELARHLLDSFELHHVAVEITDDGDQYDPVAKAVRLLPRHYSGRSLAAVAAAAHEVSHAIQDARGEKKFATWQKLARMALATDRVGGILLIASPFLAILARTPMAMVALLAVGLGLLSVRVLVNLATLPVEIDASFSKALPILEQGGYIDPADKPTIRSLLRAAAFTYLAAALISLVDIAYWIRLLR